VSTTEFVVGVIRIVATVVVAIGKVTAVLAVVVFIARSCT